MPKFTMTLAYSARCYGTVEVEADTMEDAVARVAAEYDSKPHEESLWNEVNSAESDTAFEPTVVDITGEDGFTLDDIELYHPDREWAAMDEADIRALVTGMIEEERALRSKADPEPVPMFKSVRSFGFAGEGAA